MGDAPTLDAGYNPPSLRVGGKCRASVHVVQVLVLLAVEDVVVDDLETSKARAREREMGRNNRKEGEREREEEEKPG